jgi:translation initiation factor IF-2
MKEKRSPVVAIMGHIDHGKSTLIDYIRKSNTTLKEAGGITQHIRAYEIRHMNADGREDKITFLDTPGHEAFSNIRERGAKVADIVLLIVSSEDGVKPQTIEAMKRIEESKTPFIVVITKIDRPNANIDRVKQNLAEHKIYVEGYGGTVPAVPISAKTGQGVDELLEIIALQSEIEGYSSETDELGSGIIIETRLDSKKGIIGIGVLKNGTVRRGLLVASRGATASLRSIADAEGNSVEELGASSPIQIFGWDKQPEVGAIFKTFLKKSEALAYADKEKMETPIREVIRKIEDGVVTVPFIVKADAVGSLEAIVSEIHKLKRERVFAHIVNSGVGAVTESDVKTAFTSNPQSTILAFNAKLDSRATAYAERFGVVIYHFSIIYELIDKVKELLKMMEPVIETEEVVGKTKVLRVFGASKDKQLIGGRVLEGEIRKNAQIRVMRRDSEIARGKIKGLQQSKIAVDSVTEGLEFGAMVESKFEIVPGDILEAFVLVTK